MTLRYLNNAFLRIDRAEEHIADLRNKQIGFILNDDVLNGDLHPDVSSEFSDAVERINASIDLNVTWPPMVSVARFSIIIGETIYNLRAALDYLVYALALKDSGQTQERTQFPIEGRPDNFWRRAGRGPKGVKDPRFCLPGVNCAHIADIETLQPYSRRKGNEWLRRLRDLSNPDKHRHLTVLSTQFLGVPQAHITIDGVTATEDVPPPAVWTGEVRSTDEKGREVHVKFHIANRIAFNDGLRVVETLELLELHVRQTLQAFESEF